MFSTVLGYGPGEDRRIFTQLDQTIHQMPVFPQPLSSASSYRNFPVSSAFFIIQAQLLPLSKTNFSFCISWALGNVQFSALQSPLYPFLRYSLAFSLSHSLFPLLLITFATACSFNQYFIIPAKYPT